MLLKVISEAAEEVFLAHQAHQHHEKTRAFTVDNGAVEEIRDILDVLDLDFHWLDARQAVALEGAKNCARIEVVPGRKLRTNLIGRIDFHHICKRFIEPEVIPPFHGNKITKPHVRQLVSNHDSNILAVVEGRFLVREHRNLTKSDETPVFHRASFEIWYRKEIHFRKRERRLETIVIEIQYIGGEFGRILQVFNLLVEAGVRGNFHAMLGFGLIFYEVTNREGQEISRHLRSILEDDGFRLGVGLFGHNRHVRDNRISRRTRGNREAKHRFGGWLIDTWETFARIVRFELSRNEAAGFALILVGREINTLHIALNWRKIDKF